MRALKALQAAYLAEQRAIKEAEDARKKEDMVHDKYACAANEMLRATDGNVSSDVWEKKKLKWTKAISSWNKKKELLAKKEKKEIASHNKTQEKQKEFEASLTGDQWQDAYESIRLYYKFLLGEVKRIFGWDDAMAEKTLFGSPEEFFYELPKASYKDHNPHGTEIAHGYQTQERKFNLPFLLTMFEEDVCNAKNVRVLTGYTASRNETKGKRNYSIKCVSDTGKNFNVDADMVIDCTGGDSFKFTPPLEGEEMIASLRAMAYLEIPENCKTNSACILEGKRGGTFSRINAETALAYIPQEGVAYIKDYLLPRDNINFGNWKGLVKEVKNEAFLKLYHEKIKKRHPFLANSKILDVEFQVTLREEDIRMRRKIHAAEKAKNVPHGVGQGMRLLQQQEQIQAPSSFDYYETEPGLIKAVFPKFSYFLDIVIGVTDIVERRKSDPENPDLFEANKRCLTFD